MQKKGAQLISCDLKDFFLALLMDQEDYMQIDMKYFPQDIIQRYKIHEMCPEIDMFISK